MKAILLAVLILHASKASLELLNEASEQCAENGIGQCKNHSTETNEDNNLDEGEEILNRWACSLDEVQNEQSLATLKGMIKKGEEEIDKQNYDTKNTVLVLGNAGAGKTTFVQFMAGDNSKLISKEISSDFGTYIIEDGNKIGMSVTESFTLYPDAIQFTPNESLTDTPGFKDTRSEQHEIVESYVMKKYLKSVKNIKIALIITYNSLEKGSYKDDFINLLQNLNIFIKDVDKYKESIALIATKVPNMYTLIKSNVTLISDEKIISTIGEYLIDVKQSLTNKLQESNKGRNEGFLKNAVVLVDSLLQKDENLDYKKINIFRRPLGEGTLSQMPLLQKEKLSLQKTLNDLSYSEISESNVGYTLSERAINFLHCLSWYINEKISKISLHAFNSLQNHYEAKIEKYTDIYTLHSELEELLRKLKSLKNELKVSNNYEMFSSHINKYMVNENIPSNQLENSTLLDFELHEYINSLQQFTNTSKILSTIAWSEQMKTLLNYIEENLSWYTFLIKILEYSSTYKLQNIKTKNFNMTNVNDEELNELEKTILTNINWFDDKSETHFNILALEDKRKDEINSIFQLTLKEQNNITCDKNGKLIIKGYYIKFSEISNVEFLKSQCNNKNISVVGVYAIHTVFIDADFNNEYFKGVDIVIAAPNWEIIGSRIINIDGTAGKGYVSSAKDGENYGENGKDGMRGMPGGNGGNFLGIGLNFINEHNLIIGANGGAGGPGQNGGNGQEGSKGTEGYEKFYYNLPNNWNYNTKWTEGMTEFPFMNEDWETRTITNNTLKTERFCYDEISVYSHDGDCGETGGRGGNGGVGGMGGFNGTIILIGEKETPQFVTQSLPGLSGNPGKGGYGGKTGDKGKPSTCFKVYMRNTEYRYESNYWICTNFINEAISCNTSTALDGRANYSANGNQELPYKLVEPSEPHVQDFSSDLYSYTQLLKYNENNKFLVHLVKKLQSQIYKKLYSMKNLFWRFIFVQETTPIFEQETSAKP